MQNIPPDSTPDTPAVPARPLMVTVQTDAPGKSISPDLVGVFFEDISHAADGGLYAELVQNRSFEYSSADRDDWTSLTAWEPVLLDGADGTVSIETADPLHPNSPHHAVLTLENAGAGLGIRNEGFDGIPVKAGETYNLALFARQIAGTAGPLNIRIESKEGNLLAETTLPAPSADWEKHSASLISTATDDDARLVVLATAPGQIALDMISLFPANTFRNRPNGLRDDLARVIADLKPRFLRFPGGCLVHGDGLDNIYHWKDTIGPVEQRKGQPNIWRYHQSVGLGYFEYFQFCEDIGAKPLPVVAAGVCCQNSNQRVTKQWGTGQKGIPMEQMPAYVQDVLDLIEYANGSPDSPWGAKRAAAGHPEPFHLEYLGIGNEDHITPVFKERFQMIHDAVKAKYPEITLIGTVGPLSDGEDYDKGWEISDELGLEMVDEHYYKPPQWYWENLQRYDAYDRARAQVYLGEWAAHDEHRLSTLRSAIAEAAYLTSLERNGDIVRMASYAPLLAKKGHVNWAPNLVFFNNTDFTLTLNYHVQRLFSEHSGDRWLTTTVNDSDTPVDFAASTVRNSRTGDIILKLVNGTQTTLPLRLELAGIENQAFTAEATVLADPNPDETNGQTVYPQTYNLPVAPTFDYEAPANSLTVLRIKTC